MTAPIVPITGSTPIYGLEYLLEGEAAFHYRAKMERNAKKLETLFQARAVAPPAAADLAALAGRVSTRELMTWIQCDAAQPAFAGGVWTTVPCTFEQIDTLNGHSGSQAGFVAPWAGVFEIQGFVPFANTAVYNRIGVRLTLNGATMWGSTLAPAPVATNYHLPSPAFPFTLAAGDAVQLQAFHEASTAQAAIRFDAPTGSRPHLLVKPVIRL